MTHRTSTQKPRAIVGTPWFIRKAIYVVVGLVGLVAVAFGIVSPEQADGWLAQAGSLAAVLGGFLAGANTGRASDETPAQEMARINPQPVPPAFDSYDALRDELGVNYAD